MFTKKVTEEVSERLDLSLSDASQVEVESEIAPSSKKLNCSVNENCKTQNKTHEENSVSKPVSLTEFDLGGLLPGQILNYGNKTICDGNTNINMEWELVRNLNSLSRQS